jgi:putative membrane protein
MMMQYYGPGMNGWTIALMILSNVVFWALVIFACVAVFRYLRRRNTTSDSHSTSDPQEILAQRFARGEIDADEYTSRVQVLNRIATSTVTR